jgi:hypothetical protein
MEDSQTEFLLVTSWRSAHYCEAAVAIIATGSGAPRARFCIPEGGFNHHQIQRN